MTWAEFMRQCHEGPGLPRAVLDDLTCAACRSHEATTVRVDALVCGGCVHMIDPHGVDALWTCPGGLKRSTQQTGRTLRMVSSSPTSVEGDC
jgi:hypothetical protein